MPPELCLSLTTSYDSRVSNYGLRGKSARHWHFSALLQWRGVNVDLSWPKRRGLWAGGAALILKTPQIHNRPNLNTVAKSASAWPSYWTTNWIHFNEILEIDFQDDREWSTAGSKYLTAGFWLALQVKRNSDEWSSCIKGKKKGKKNIQKTTLGLCHLGRRQWNWVIPPRGRGLGS